MTFLTTFKVPVSIHLDAEQIKEAQAALNTYYLGDAECNFLNPETMQYEAKYPEKETEEFKNSMASINRTHIVFLTIGLDYEGNFSVIR